jgi:hypothetical protein
MVAAHFCRNTVDHLCHPQLEKKTQIDMIRSIITVLLFSCSSTIAEGIGDNGIIKGVVTDQHANGVAYVNVGFVNTTYGTVTSSDGSFTLYFPTEMIGPDDSLRFSMIGFEVETVGYRDYSDTASGPLRIIMTAKSYAIQPVEISSEGLKRVVEGNSNITTTMSNNMAISGLPGQNLGAEVGRKFFFGKKPHHIEKLNFYIRYCNFDTVVFRVNIYEIQNGKPGRNISGANMVFTVTGHKKGWVTFDLSRHHLVFDSNVIIALEWVGSSQKGSLLGFPITVPSPGAVHYYKFGSQSKWKKFVSMSTAMNVEALTEP